MPNCIHCGAALAPGAMACPNCGAAVSQAAPGQPVPPAAQQGGFGAPPGSQPGYNPAPAPAPGPAQGYGAPAAGPPPGPVPPFIGWGIAALVQCILCQGYMFVLPIVGVIFAFIGKSEWDQGKTESAMSKLKLAKMMTIIGYVLVGLFWFGIIFVSFILPLMMVGAGMAAQGASY